MCLELSFDVVICWLLALAVCSLGCTFLAAGLASIRALDDGRLFGLSLFVALPVSSVAPSKSWRHLLASLCACSSQPLAPAEWLDVSLAPGSMSLNADYNELSVTDTKPVITF